LWLIVGEMRLSPAALNLDTQQLDLS
jgi:hypothetical protein